MTEICTKIECPWRLLVGRDDIGLCPKAFVSKEELTRTLFHEKIHVEQFCEYGTEYVQDHVFDFEKLAEAAENAFIAKLKEDGRL